MNINSKQIVIETLHELQSAPIGVETDSDYKELIGKYNMMFLGSNFSVITSLELAHFLKANKDLPISHDSLLKLLPEIKDVLSLRLEAQVRLDDASLPNRQVANYLIHLF